MQINAANLVNLTKGFRTIFVQALQGASPDWARIAMRVPSMAASEVYHWLGAVPGMKKLVGEVNIRNLNASNYTIVNDEWESTVGVKQTDIERDTYGLYNPLMSAMGMAAAEHPDELIADLLTGGFTNLDYTGLAFFAADKPHNPDVEGSPKFSNKGTGALSASTYKTAKANLKGRTNAEGRSMKLGRKLLLVVSPQNEDTGLEILKAERAANGSTNVQKDTAELFVFSALGTTAKWFLLDVGHPVQPLIYQEEKPPVLEALTSMDSDHVFKNHEFLYQAYGRWQAGYGLPQLAYGSTAGE